MTLVYIGIFLNFILMVGSWVFFLKLLESKQSNSYLEIEDLRNDLDLVTKNPSAARRKLKSRQ